MIPCKGRRTGEGTEGADPSSPLRPSELVRDAEDSGTGRQYLGWRQELRQRLPGAGDAVYERGRSRLSSDLPDERGIRQVVDVDVGFEFAALELELFAESQIGCCLRGETMAAGRF